MTDTHSGCVQTHRHPHMHTHPCGAPGSLGNHRNHIFGMLTSPKRERKPTRKGTLKRGVHLHECQLLSLIIMNKSDAAISCLNAARFILYVVQLRCQGPLTLGSSSGFCHVLHVCQASDISNRDTLATLQECYKRFTQSSSLCPVSIKSPITDNYFDRNKNFLLFSSKLIRGY